MMILSSACTKTLTDALAKHSFVAHVEVILLSNSAKVTYDQNGVSADEIKEVIEETGYGAEVVATRPLETKGLAHEIAGGVTLRSTFEVRGMTCA